MQKLRVIMVCLAVALTMVLLSSCGGGGSTPSPVASGEVDSTGTGLDAALVGPLATYMPPAGTVTKYAMFGAGDRTYTFKSYTATTATLEYTQDWGGLNQTILTFAKSGTQTVLKQTKRWMSYGGPAWSDGRGVYSPAAQIGLFGAATGTSKQCLYTRIFYNPTGYTPATEKLHGRVTYTAVKPRAITVHAGTYTCVGFVVHFSAGLISPSAAKVMSKLSKDATFWPAVTVWLAPKKGIIAIDMGDTGSLSTASAVLAKLPHLMSAESISGP